MTVKVRVKKGLTYRNIKLAAGTVLEIPKTTAERRKDVFEPLVSGLIVPESVRSEATVSEEEKPTGKPKKRSKSRKDNRT